jgi:hypothetical protein
MHIHMDHDLGYRVEEDRARPMVFEPSIDWDTFTEPNILDAF